MNIWYYTKSEIPQVLYLMKDARKMKDKKKDNKDKIPQGFNEEFRRVRFYSNINGVEKEYGYDYKRDNEGKEEYREIGEIPEQLGEGFIDRINNIERSFDWNRDFFGDSFKRLTEFLPSFNRMFGSFSEPELKAGDKSTIQSPQKSSTSGYDVAYDMQINKETEELYLIVELPGFSKEDIKLKLVKKHLQISGNNGKREINTKIPIEYEIEKGEKISATMKNGILEVKMKLLEVENGNGKEISIN